MSTRPPVIFIPGFPASELVEDSIPRAEGRTPRAEVTFPPSLSTLASKSKKQKFIDTVTDLSKLEAGEPIRDVFFGIEKQAQSLYDILRLYGYSLADPAQFRAIGWDWRRAVDDAKVQADLRDALETMVTNGRRALVIAHSTGGLVLRQLLDGDPGLATKIHHVLSLGVPWAGTLKSMRYLVKGESTGIPGAKLHARESAFIIRHAQAAYDLLPPPRNLNHGTDAPPAFVFESGNPVSPMVATSWIPASWKDHMDPMAHEATRLRRPASFPIASMKITAVAGFGATTDVRADIVSGSATFTAGPEGDGTVPHASATWIEGEHVRIFSLPVGIYPSGGLPIRHARIWDAPPMLGLFDELLLGAAPEPFIAAALDADDASMGGQRDMKVLVSGADAAGKPLQPMGVTFTNLRQQVTATVNGRGVVTIPKTALPSATGSHFVRFDAIVTWSSGTREIPLMYQRS